MFKVWYASADERMASASCLSAFVGCCPDCIRSKFFSCRVAVESMPGMYSPRVFITLLFSFCLLARSSLEYALRLSASTSVFSASGISMLNPLLPFSPSDADGLKMSHNTNAQTRHMHGMAIILLRLIRCSSVKGFFSFGALSGSTLSFFSFSMCQFIQVGHLLPLVGGQLYTLNMLNLYI